MFVFTLFENKAPSMISKFHLVISSSINLLFPEECDPLQLEESRGHFLQNGMTSKSSFSYILNPWEEGKSQNMTCSSFYIIIFPFILKRKIGISNIHWTKNLIYFLCLVIPLKISYIKENHMENNILLVI